MTMLETPLLTARQQEIHQFLMTYVDEHGYPPTVREIGDAVGLASPSTVHAHLANLERVGLIRRDPTKPRALEVVGRPRQATPRRDPKPPSSRSSAASRPAGRCSPRRPSRTASRCRRSSVGTPTSSSA
jgi:SOS-response transcriptional repressor LexA